MNRILIFCSLSLLTLAFAACESPQYVDEADLPEGVESMSYEMGREDLCGGTCPGGWVNLSCVAIDCAPGFDLIVKDFGDDTCGRCGRRARGGPPAPTTCQVTGCSGQLCASEPIATTCEFRPEYACYQQFGNCGNFGPGGGCDWEPTPELNNCLANGGL